MVNNSGQQKGIQNVRTKEKIEKLLINVFYNLYVKKEIPQVLSKVSDKIQWIAGKKSWMAKNKQELIHLLEDEIQEMPEFCCIKIIENEAIPAGRDCFSVNGLLELKLPYETEIVYQEIRYMATIVKTGSNYKIISLLLAVVSENRIAENESELNTNELRQSSNLLQHDMLTGLCNLDRFKKISSDYLKQHNRREYAIVYTDIFNFEKINNMYGFHIGDEILMSFSVLVQKLNKNVIYSCRCVADHISMLVKVDTDDKLKKDILKLNSLFAETISSKYPDASLRIGAGVYFLNDEEEPMDQVIENANMARKSIRSHSSCAYAVYDPMVFRQSVKIKEIEKVMQFALNEGQFQVFLQPKYNLKTIQIVGAEALIRWIKPDGTMIYPDEFIPVFEANGFIEQIDFFVLDVVCNHIKKQLDLNKPCFPISVNQSRFLLNDTYVSKIAEVIHKYDIPPNLIELELTERLFSDQLGEMADIMKQVKRLGIRWSIDDFGAGYSSLNLLKELPVDIIKIDKGFLNETETSDTSKTIIRKTVELTRELKKLVVCEGVETQEQAEYLKTICCDMAQGYLYARPMPIIDYEELIAEKVTV